jgi:hypothetical protein
MIDPDPRILAFVPASWTFLGAVADFLAGAFLCNSLPHLVSGLQGMPFPSPFAKPPGIGDSSPLVNFLWGFLNLLIGAAFLSGHPVTALFGPDFAALATGFLLIGVLTSRHFGKVRRDRSAR